MKLYEDTYIRLLDICMLRDLSAVTFVELDCLRVDVELRRDKCNRGILEVGIVTLGHRVINARAKSLNNTS